MPWPSPAELDCLVARFQDRTLPSREWTHLAHLAVGTWHVRRLGIEEALRRLRPAIRSLNDAHGTPNSDTRGYHETITRAYVALIAHVLSDTPADATPAACVARVLASRFAAKDALLEFYSSELLLSVTARRDWTPPDRTPLPR